MGVLRRCEVPLGLGRSLLSLQAFHQTNDPLNVDQPRLPWVSVPPGWIAGQVLYEQSDLILCVGCLAGRPATKKMGYETFL